MRTLVMLIAAAIASAALAPTPHAPTDADQPQRVPTILDGERGTMVDPGQIRIRSQKVV